MIANHERAPSDPSHALDMAQLALEAALRPPEGAVTASVEAQVQKALDLLRAGKVSSEAVGKLEAVSTMLQAMLIAKREGRPNLYASKLLRLRRLVLS